MPGVEVVLSGPAIFNSREAENDVARDLIADGSPAYVGAHTERDVRDAPPLPLPGTVLGRVTAPPYPPSSRYVPLGASLDARAKMRRMRLRLHDDGVGAVL